MRRGRLLILVGLLLIVVVGGLFLVISLRGGGGEAEPAAGAQAQATQAPPADLVQVVVAIQDIGRGSEVVEEAITLAPWPREQLLPEAITEPGDVIGKLARRDILRGEPVLTTLVVDNALEVSEAGSNWATYIPDGMVAITIPAPRLTGYYGANLLRDGDHVNVFVSLLLVDLDLDFQTALPNITVPVALTDLSGSPLGGGVDGGGGGASGGASEQPLGRFETIPGGPSGLFPAYVVPGEANQRPRLVTQQIIQDAIVLGVGVFIDAADAAAAEPTATPDPNVPPTPTPEGGPPPPTPVPPPETITLIVSPQDAVALTYFVHTPAKFSVALRPAGDISRSDTEAVTLEYLVNNYRITIPEPLEYGITPAISRLDVPTLSGAANPVFVTVPPPDTDYLCIGANCP